jgi:hypothetical protein
MRRDCGRTARQLHTLASIWCLRAQDLSEETPSFTDVQLATTIVSRERFWAADALTNALHYFYGSP